jgi:hypothetical protein
MKPFIALNRPFVQGILFLRTPIGPLRTYSV